MKMLNIFAVMFGLIIPFVCFAEIEKISDLDQKLYYPQDQSLKDLYLEAEIVGLSELVKKRLDNPKIQEIKFKIYWLFPGKISIDVEGINGFEELKTELKMMIAEKLDLIIPEKMGQKFRSYTMKKKTGGIDLVDETGDKLISKVSIDLDDNDVIKKVRVLGAGIDNTINYKATVKRWATNRYSFDKVDIENVQLGRKSKRVDEISYGVVQGYGLPFEITTQQYMEMENSKEKPQTSTIVYKFKNYRANEGIALKYFNSKK
ncbi:MAG: hypothetical protein Fur0010_07830 [Bdellovibrio sp.]